MEKYLGINYDTSRNRHTVPEKVCCSVEVVNSMLEVQVNI